MRCQDLPPDSLFHLAVVADVAAYRRSGTIQPPSLAAEGFVHCSWGRQVSSTVQKHFGGVRDLVAMEVDPARLDPGMLVEEDSYGSGERFPHVYGPIPVSAILLDRSLE